MIATKVYEKMAAMTGNASNSETIPFQNKTPIQQTTNSFLVLLR